MAHADSLSSSLPLIASVAVVSGAAAALATILAVKVVGDDQVHEQAQKWSRWLGFHYSRVEKAASDSAHQCCCGHQRSLNQPQNPPKQKLNDLPLESGFKEAGSLGSHHIKPLATDHIETKSLDPPRERNAWKSSQDPETGVSRRLDELLEGAKDSGEASPSGQSADISSIDLRTPEKQPRLLDQSLGATSPALPGKPDPEDPSKRKGYLSWDDYFMAVAFLSAQRSKDPNRQVGACIVSQERIILGIGYNGFPRGCSDDQLPWAKSSKDGDLLKTKYPYVCHAELNAILNRNHASAPGQKMYVTMFPCNECAKLIIQSGISEVIYYTDKGGHERDIGPGDPRPEIAYAASKRLLKLAGVKMCQHKPAKASITLDFR
ncbi:Deoxycytidylate deaminase [Klebsormidium nitens]|uniref:dCMP deaminase n=1 Tax=Klebsormidium nitens TaxID=105231 RepID=A0A1Y1I2Z7_KLENI|nr:Deoxycytidylate deaminase [Klebsormidium nitens]|eukprot:GAQ84843.1 Deoxycytidylate deaminase [Klebsormidium nitens]